MVFNDFKSKENGKNWRNEEIKLISTKINENKKTNKKNSCIQIQ